MIYDPSAVFYVCASSGYRRNEYDSLYLTGIPYDFAKKINVAEEYLRQSTAAGGLRPCISAVSRAAKVSRCFVRRIEREINEKAAVTPTVVGRKSGGPGGYSLDALDYYLILRLYRELPTRTLASYVEELQLQHGVSVCVNTMKDVLLKSFAYRSNLHACNVVPLDKFRPTNLVKAFNFRNDLIKFHPRRVKCIDEKLIKGEELYHRRARRDPETGVVPPTYSTADFRNSYSCLGMTSINPQNEVAFFHKIHDRRNDSHEFGEYIDLAINCGFLRPWDVLVADNAKYHFYGDNCNLIDYL